MIETRICSNDSIRKQKMKKIITNYLIALILIIYSVLTILPFYFVFIRSFVPTAESTKLHVWIPGPREFNMEARYGDLSVYYNLDTKDFKQKVGIEGYIAPQSTFNQIAQRYGIPKDKIKNYLKPYMNYNGWYSILKDSRFVKSVFFTFLITLFSILIGGFLAIATGSVLAGFKKKWHMYVYNLYLIQIIIPPTMIMLPLYFIVTRVLHLEDSYTTLLLINIKGGALSTMIFTTYISTIPKELEESVNMDGGNKVRYFFHVLLPLTKVPLGTYMALHIPLFWNDLINGLLFLNPDKYTLVPLINSLQGTYSTNFQAIYSGLSISLVPILIVYLLFQKLFIKSAMAGAVKG